MQILLLKISELQANKNFIGQSDVYKTLEELY